METALQRTFGILLLAMTLWGCVHEPVIELSPGHSALQRWLDRDLAPYLSEQLSDHPRFKGEPVILVQLDGQDIQADIDGLTRMMRDQLMDRLLTEPGITLPWQPQRQQQRHHRRLDRVQCRRVHDASYYIGIEITEVADGRHRVSVRALDVKETAWVSGFGRSWTGRLTTGERDARQAREPDESLRGLRVLPFDDREPDLAATYLANNLSCLLRQGDNDDLVLHVEALQSEQTSLRILPSLIGNNLSRFREVRVTSEREEANLVLRGEAYEIHDGLHQVWVVLSPSESGEHLSGMDTATWIQTASAPERAVRSRAHEPRSAGPQRPEIRSLRVIHGEEANRSCIDGRLNDRLDQCRSMQLTVKHSQGVFVFMHDPRDGISRLSSGHCVIDHDSNQGHLGSIRYAIPAGRVASSGWPTVYAIAVSDLKLAKQLDQHLALLPDACTAGTGLSAETTLNPWLDRLDGLMAGKRNQTAWMARRLR